MTDSQQNNRILDCRPSITGKIAFVTGGFGGIGRECVKALLAHGANVAFTYVDGLEPKDRVDEIVAKNSDCVSAHKLDLRFAKSIQTCMDEVMERWGRIDILINNAAVGSATVSAFSDKPSEQDSAMHRG